MCETSTKESQGKHGQSCLVAGTQDYATSRMVETKRAVASFFHAVLGCEFWSYRRHDIVFVIIDFW